MYIKLRNMGNQFIALTQAGHMDLEWSIKFIQHQTSTIIILEGSKQQRRGWSYLCYGEAGGWGTDGHVLSTCDRPGPC